MSDEQPADGVFRTARSRARAEVTGEILAAARQELSEVGAVALSLRSVARRVGMAPSALYRYFRGRDDLLTALIVDAYDGLADRAEHADNPKQDATTRWLAVCAGVRYWARAHPHEFTLIYGSPVPGYAAPPDTIGPATRLFVVFAGILTDALAAGVLTPARRPLPRLVRPAIVAEYGSPPPPFHDLIERTVMVWTTLIGTIHFELFGHLRPVVADLTEYFLASMSVAAETIGLPPLS